MKQTNHRIKCVHMLNFHPQKSVYDRHFGIHLLYNTYSRMQKFGCPWSNDMFCENNTSSTENTLNVACANVMTHFVSFFFFNQYSNFCFLIKEDVYSFSLD